MIAQCRTYQRADSTPDYPDSDFVALPPMITSATQQCPDTLDEMLFKVRAIRSNHSPPSSNNPNVHNTVTPSPKKARTNNYKTFCSSSNSSVTFHEDYSVNF